ncbi:MAG: hypothetical protein AAF514_22270, partial [Verrucomicrobiota bacterium]
MVGESVAFDVRSENRMKAVRILFTLAIAVALFPAQAGDAGKEKSWSGKSVVPDLGEIEFERHKWNLKHKILYPDDPKKPSSFVFETIEEPFIRLTIQRYPTKTTNSWGSNPHVYGDLIVETIGAGMGLPFELHRLLKKVGDSKPDLATGQGVSWDAVTPKATNPYLRMVNVHYFETEGEIP